MKSPDPPIEHLKSIVNLFNSAKPEQAVEDSKILLDDYPKSFFLHNIIGASNAALKQFDAAIDSYKMAIKIKPNYAEAYYNMAIAQKEIGALEAAVESYKKAIELKPDYFDSYFNMGNILRDMGDLEASIDCFRKTIKIKPNYAEAYFNMAIAQKEIGTLEAAVESYKKAIELKPYFIEAKDNLITLLTTFIPKKDASNKIVELNEDIKNIDINADISSIISDDQIVSFVSKSEEFITNVDIKHKTKLSQTFRRNSVNLNCSRHMSIFNEHNIIPEFCFGCYKVQVEPKSIIELIKLFIVFDQLELHENNTRKCMVELRPEVSGFYKGLIFCSGLKQANQISDYLNIIIKQSISPQLVSKVKRGCSEYAIAHPDYKEINNSGPQLMNYNEEWKIFEESFDRSNPIETNEITRTSLSGLNLNDALIIQKWIDYAKGIGDSSADILKQNTVYYQEIYDQAKARLK